MPLCKAHAKAPNTMSSDIDQLTRVWSTAMRQTGGLKTDERGWAH